MNGRCKSSKQDRKIKKFCAFLLKMYWDGLLPPLTLGYAYEPTAVIVKI